MHPCQLIYKCATESPVYGDTKGACRITGDISKGIPFMDWVKKTFTDEDQLRPGDIISNEALLCFEEKSELLKEMTGRDKLQRFRTYSHFVVDNEWMVFTKADKQEMKDILLNRETQLAVLSDSGQRHLVFKSKIGTWQLEDEIMMPDREGLSTISELTDSLYGLGFTQEEIRTGHYENWRIFKIGMDVWMEFENELKKYRGSPHFDLACFLMTKKEVEQPEQQLKPVKHEQRQGELFGA